MLPSASNRCCQVGIRHGNGLWREFLSKTYAEWYGAAALFDYKNVVNTMSYEEACVVGVELDHSHVVVSYLCSEVKDVEADEQPYWPMIAELGGYIFCDVDVGHSTNVDVYHEDWMGNCGVGVKGDKGQVASLLRKPSLLFDDTEKNVQLLRARSTRACPLDGFIVRRRPKATDPVQSGFEELSNCNDWVTVVEAFGARPAPVDDLVASDPPVDLSRRMRLCDGCGYPQKFVRTLRGRPARNWRPSGLRGAASGSCAPALGEQAEGCAVTGDGCSDSDSMEAQEDTKEGSAGAGGGAQRSDEREEAA